MKLTEEQIYQWALQQLNERLGDEDTYTELEELLTDKCLSEGLESDQKVSEEGNGIRRAISKVRNMIHELAGTDDNPPEANPVMIVLASAPAHGRKWAVVNETGEELNEPTTKVECINWCLDNNCMPVISWQAQAPLPKWVKARASRG